MPNFITDNGKGHWVYPIGPAPEGWEQRENCSCTIPHTEAATSVDSWQDLDMNLDHYSNLRFIAFVNWDEVVGVYDTLWDAANALKQFKAKNGGSSFFIEAWTGSIHVSVPNNWRDGVNL